MIRRSCFGFLLHALAALALLVVAAANVSSEDSRGTVEWSNTSGDASGVLALESAVSRYQPGRVVNEPADGDDAPYGIAGLVSIAWPSVPMAGPSSAPSPASPSHDVSAGLPRAPPTSA